MFKVIIVSKCLISMFQVTESIYCLVGNEPRQKLKVQKMEQVFSAMDINKDGVVTKEEFVNYCINDNDIYTSFTFLP